MVDASVVCGPRRRPSSVRRTDRPESTSHHPPAQGRVSRGIVSPWPRNSSSSRSAVARSPSPTPRRCTSRTRATPRATSSATTRPSPMARWPASAAGRWRSSASSTGSPRSRSSRSAPRTTRPSGWRTAELTFPSGRTADEIVVEDAAGLAWINNLGCIDLNPHPVRADDLDHPDELRVDLDPVPGHRVGPDPRRRDGLQGGARGVRPRRLAEDLRLARHPHQRPHRAALDVPGGPPCRPRPGPRRGAASAGPGHEQVVEGGAPRRLPRLQPEREGPDGRLGLLDPAAARRARLHAADLGRGPDGRSRGVHDRDRARRGSPRSAIRAPASTTPSARWRRSSSSAGGTRPRARATPRGRRTTPSRPASRRGSSRRRRGAPSPSTSRVAARAAGRRRRSPPNGRRPSPPATRTPGLPTEWEGTRPTPTGRRKSNVPVIEISRAASKAEALEGLDRWKARHPEAAAALESADVLVDGMRGRSSLWYRVRVNLTHVPEADRPPQEPLDPDYDPWAGYDIEAWQAQTNRKRTPTGRKPKAATAATDRQPEAEPPRPTTTATE